MVLWLFQVFFLEKFYMFIKSNSVKDAANEVNEVITKRFKNEITEHTYVEEINRIAEQNDFCVIVFDRDTPNHPLQSYTMNTRCKATQLKYERNTDVIQQLKEKAEDNGGIASILVEDKKPVREVPRPSFDEIEFTLEANAMHTFISPMDIYFYNMRKKDESKNLTNTMQNMTYMSVVTLEGKMKTSIINAQLTPVSATIETIKTQFFIIAMILIFVALLLALYLSKKIAKPIMAINYGAKKLAIGSYDVKFQEKDYLEIKELSDTLNYAAKELSKVDMLRKELIANMSHDLRTPLTMISGYGEVMRDIPGENTPENVQIIIDETQRLTHLVNDMLDLSKIQAGVQEINPIPFNLSAEIRSILQRYDKLLSTAKCEFIFDYTEDVFIFGDIIKINQVIYNLINNAFHYCGDDHVVIVRQRIAGDKVCLEIIDHGDGIDEEQIPYIWERYYKIDKTHTRSRIGSGLGLSIVKALLEMHKAEYGVKSKKGKETIFWFCLPIYREK